MITKELIKTEVDKVQDEYLVTLYKIIKAFEMPTIDLNRFTNSNKRDEELSWRNFIEKFSGCLANNPIKRSEHDEILYDPKVTELRIV